MKNNSFWHEMSRDEVCRAYANDKGREYDFTDKDYEWVDYHEMALVMSDHELRLWCEENL